MIKFEEHDGKLFRMLEKPTPLTPDAEMPCLVRLIQDDSPMGKHNKDVFGYDPERLTPRICTEVIDVNDLSDHNRGSARCDGFISCQHYHYELIGTPVKEGSHWWALYQMMSGKKVCNPILATEKAIRFGYDDVEQFNTFWYIVGDAVVEGKSNYGILSVSSWIAAASSTGWKLYEPKQKPEPESMGLAKQICEIDHNLPKGLTSCEAIGLAGFCKECFAKNDGCWKEQKDMKEKPGSEQPKPESQYKVGDWVEYRLHANTAASDNNMMGQIIDIGRIGGTSIEVLPVGNYEHNTSLSTYHVIYASRIIRKLKPSEVIVNIGCLSGTVDDLSYAADGRFWLIGKATERCPVGMFALLYDEMLDDQTRELVESLLKAQRRGDIK